jgi:iron complex outermembrane receptor protein
MMMPFVRLDAALMVMGVLLLIAAPAPAQERQQQKPVDDTAVARQEEGGEEPRAEFRQELVVMAAHPQLATEVVYSGHEIERDSSQDLGCFLRGLAGVSSSRKGAIGLDPQVRGLQETQVGVFVDGTRTFAAGPARMDSDMAHLSPRAVERMRIVKGPYALTWGAGSLSAIQLDTFRPSFGGDELRLSGRLGLAYGDNASASDGYVGLSGANEKVRFQTLVQRRAGGDWEDGAGAVVPGDYRSQDVRWNVGYRLGKGAVVEYTGGYQEQKDVDYPGRLLDADYFYTRSHAVDLQWIPDRARIARVYAQVYTNRKDHRMNNDEKPTAQPMPGRIPPFGLDVVLPTESNTAGARLSLGGNLGALFWTAGLDSYFLEQTANRSIFRRDNGLLLFEDIVWPEARIDDIGAYYQLARRGPGSTLAVTLRADFVDASAGAVSGFFLANTSGGLDQDETSLSAAVSGSFRLGDAWTVTAGVGRAVRTASAMERYSDRLPSSKFQIAAEFMGSPGIGPEESLQFDLGAGYQSAGLVLEIEAFLRTIRDYITVEPDPALPKRLPLSPSLVYRYVHGAEAEFSGVDLRVVHRATDFLEWRSTASYVRGEDTLFDEPVFGLPPLTGQLGLRLTPRSDLWVDLNLTMASRQNRVAEVRLERPTPGYSYLDVLLSLEPSPDWRLSLGVDNAGDKRYVHHLNTLNPFTGERIAEQGFNLRAAVEYSF